MLPAMVRSARRFGPLFLALLAACSAGGARESEQKPAVPVAIAPVVQKDAPVTLRAIGTVEAYSTVSLRPQIEGRLERVAFREGQEVRAGDLLFRIDRRPFESALREAEANRARDHAQAENARVEAGRCSTSLPARAAVPVSRIAGRLPDRWKLATEGPRDPSTGEA